MVENKNESDFLLKNLSREWKKGKIEKKKAKGEEIKHSKLETEMGWSKGEEKDKLGQMLTHCPQEIPSGDRRQWHPVCPTGPHRWHPPSRCSRSPPDPRWVATRSPVSRLHHCICPLSHHWQLLHQERGGREWDLIVSNFKDKKQTSPVVSANLRSITHWKAGIIWCLNNSNYTTQCALFLTCLFSIKSLD